MRASFTGTLHVGELQVRVKACPMTNGTIEEFHVLHRTCLLPLSQEYRCPGCQLLVAPGDRVKGIESGGRWVVFTEDELRTLRAESEDARPMFVAYTTNPNTVRPRWRLRSYFLVPELPGDYRTYRVLERALGRTRLALVVSFVDHGRTRLGTVLTDPTHPGWLVLDLLHYQSELRAPGVQPWKDVRPDAQELKLAQALLTRQVRAFSHASHVDPYPNRLKLALEAKVLRQPVQFPTKLVPVARPGPLIDALQRSLKAATARIRAGRPRPGWKPGTRRTR